LSRLRASWVIVLLAATLWGCGDSPEDRVREAWEARQQDDIEAYLGSFTERSGELFRGMLRTSERTRGELEYLDPVNHLLPSGEILSSRVEGELGSVTVAASKGEYEVLCVRERGVWVIDGLALRDLWEPLNKATR
jgi:hypothetical protein